MKCKKCGGSTRVVETGKNNIAVYRKRVCKVCKEVVFTEEIKYKDQLEARHYLYLCKDGYFEKEKL